MWRDDSPHTGLFESESSGGGGLFAGDLHGSSRYGMLSLFGRGGECTEGCEGGEGGRGDGRYSSYSRFNSQTHLFERGVLGGVLHGRFAMGCDSSDRFWLRTFETEEAEQEVKHEEIRVEEEEKEEEQEEQEQEEAEDDDEDSFEEVGAFLGQVLCLLSVCMYVSYVCMYVHLLALCVTYGRCTCVRVTVHTCARDVDILTHTHTHTHS
jgi:hypothetical protein